MLERLKRALLIALCIAMLAPVQHGYAVTSKQKALDAYNRLLSASTIYILPKGTGHKSYTAGGTRKYLGTKASNVRFSLAYIDGDNTPELVLCDNEYRFAIFTYRNGQLVRLYYDTWWNVAVQYYKNHCLFVTRRVPNLGISAVKYNCKVSGRYTTRFAVYRYRSGPKHCAEFSPGRKGKTITIQNLRTRLAAYIGGVRPSKITYRINTKLNRSRYLK